MRKSPTLLAALFIAITLTRVADLVSVGFNSGYTGWIFSVGLGLSVFVCAYFLRVNASRGDVEFTSSRRVRFISGVALIFFVLVDGLFNLTETLRQLTDDNLYFAGIVYGIFPTLAAGLLGVMQGYVDRLPKPANPYSVYNALRKTITLRLLGSTRPAESLQEPTPPTVEVMQLPALPGGFACTVCGKHYKNRQAYAGHVSHHSSKRKY